MKVSFDYLPGPVLGHKMRCEVLEDALLRRGHQIVSPCDADWNIVDYPSATLETLPVRGSGQRLVMGCYPLDARDHAWHPLAAPRARTMTGYQYLLLDTSLAGLYGTYPDISLTLTCGGQDPFRLTEKLLEILPGGNNHVVIGPGFDREITVPSGWWVHYAPTHRSLCKLMARSRAVVCAWGQTAIEALYLRPKVAALALYPEHLQEADLLGVEVCLKEHPEGVLNLLDKTIDYIPLDLRGGNRVVDYLEKHLEVI